MAFKIQTCEKLCVQWTVVLPRVGKSTLSPYFKLERQSWVFKVLTNWSEIATDETWSMHFQKKFRKEMPSKFLLSAYVRDTESNRDLFMIHKEITQYDTEIWSYTQRSFFQLFPDVDFVGNALTFVFTFDYGIRNYKDIRCVEREHKSVQTSPYLDDRMCLANLSLDLRNLLEDSSDPDVLLKCGDYSISAHKFILGARSEVFRTMLQSDMLEGREGSVEIVDMEPKVFEVFIRYIYSGTLPELTEDIASPLYEAGDKYRLEALRGRCGDFLGENLTLENACGILAMADAHSDSDLKDRVVSYIIDEEIPDMDDVWLTFCDEHPKLAIEVFSRAYKELLGSA